MVLNFPPVQEDQYVEGESGHWQLKERDAIDFTLVVENVSRRSGAASAAASCSPATLALGFQNP
jgi:hypothetical protein